MVPKAALIDLSSAKKTAELNIQEPVSGAYPDYAAALFLIRPNNEAQFSVPEAMGDYYRDQREYKKAVPLYWQAYSAMHYYIPVRDWKPLVKMGDCLEALGQHQDAEKAYKQAKQLEAKDPTAPTR
ncbi:MAG TPA: hypothetical protein VGL56_02675 [Fimbriimonadaceae bacterium]|jgi:tetratricopeptide (TPR) repeat protein